MASSEGEVYLGPVTSLNTQAGAVQKGYQVRLPSSPSARQPHVLATTTGSQALKALPVAFHFLYLKAFLNTQSANLVSLEIERQHKTLCTWPAHAPGIPARYRHSPSPPTTCMRLPNIFDVCGRGALSTQSLGNGEYVCTSYASIAEAYIWCPSRSLQMRR